MKRERKSISVPAELIPEIEAAASKEERSFSYIVCRAIRRDLEASAAPEEK